MNHLTPTSSIGFDGVDRSMGKGSRLFSSAGENESNETDIIRTALHRRRSTSSSGDVRSPNDEVHKFRHPLHDAEDINSAITRAENKTPSNSTTFGKLRDQVQQWANRRYSNTQSSGFQSDASLSDESEDSRGEVDEDNWLSSEGWERADAALIASVHETTRDMESILRRKGFGSPFWKVHEVIPMFQGLHDMLRPETVHISCRTETCDREFLPKYVYQPTPYSNQYSVPEAISASFAKPLSSEAEVFISTLQIFLKNPLRSRQGHQETDGIMLHHCKVEATDDKGDLERIDQSPTAAWLTTPWHRVVWRRQDSSSATTTTDQQEYDSDDVSMPDDRSPCCT